MITFNELRISPDGKTLIIDVSVDRLDYYKNVILDSIIIDTQDTYVPNGPSSNPIYSYKVLDAYDLTYSLPEDCSCNPVKEDEDKSYCFTYGILQMLNVRLTLTAKDLHVSLSETMFFVYVIATGTPAPDTPCGFDNSKILGTVVDTSMIYKHIMLYIKEVNSDCEVPKGFINMILRLKAVDLCIKTGNYPQAIKYWKKFFSKLSYSFKPISNCRCYG